MQQRPHDRPARAVLLRTGDELAVDWRGRRAEVKIPLQWRTELDDVGAVSGVSGC